MKRITIVLGALMCLWACTNSQTKVNRAITLDLQSGEGIINSIRLITEAPENWSQERFDSVHTAIISLAAAGALDQNINEDKSHMANLFTASAALLQYEADSVFRLSSYNGYSQMCKDLKFLKEKHGRWFEAGIDIEKKNPSLDFVSDLFAEYEKVLKNSKRTFSKTPIMLADYKLEPYNLNYTTTENSIKNNKYYTKYFSKNTAITNGIKEFPSRLSASKKKYMDELETMIEQTAVSDSLSLMQLLTIQGEFNTMARGASQEAIDALVKFVTNYVEPVKKENYAN